MATDKFSTCSVIRVKENVHCSPRPHFSSNLCNMEMVADGDKERRAASLKAFRISGVREEVAAAQRNGVRN